MLVLRRALHCSFTLALLCLAAAKDVAPKKYLLFVGTYTQKGSKGIYAYRFDAESSELTSLGVAAEIVNPSFLAADSTGRFLYTVNEVANFKNAASGAVSSFAVNQITGKLSLLNQVASRGADPCYITLDRTGKYALVANYSGGSVAAFPVQSDGRLGEAVALVQHRGSSVDKDRQEGPHAHWVGTTSEDRFAVAVDLGLDELLVYRFNAENGSLTPNDPPYAKLDPGAGPRHLAFDPNGRFAYVVNELQSTITTFSFDRDRGVLQKLASVSTLPEGFAGTNDTAEIHVHPSGRFLFASNRGHDSIVVYAIDQQTGALTLVDHFSTQGKMPRNFEIDPTGKLLFVANQESNRVVVFRIDPASGRLTPTGETLEVPTPVSLLFVPS